MNCNQSHLKQGQKLSAIWGQPNPDGQVSLSIYTHENVKSITVSQLAGPMGWFDVAVVSFRDEQMMDRIYPLHMMEQIDILPEAQSLGD